MFVERSVEKYQVITIPLVDTSAASAAGAYALTENSLYTVEAFQLFFDHLQEDGILSVSRWWYKGLLGETHRLATPAAAALRVEGIERPRNHIVFIRGRNLSTLLLSKKPFEHEDLIQLKNACLEKGFSLMLAPNGTLDPVLAQAIDNPYWYQSKNFRHLNLSAPTDDQPFFFQSYRIANFFRSDIKSKLIGVADNDKQAMTMLLGLLFLVTFLALGVVGLPFVGEIFKRKLSIRRTHFLILSFFGFIGFGFMLFESAQLQRLNIFLGYPVYSLTVVLFSLLLASSIGANIAEKLFQHQGENCLPWVCGILLISLIAIGFLTLPITTLFAGSITPVRILIALFLMIPAGFMMGMFFPLGLKMADRQKEISLAWCWAVNGMTSVCAAVYSIALAITWGFSTTYWVGILCYALASILLLKLRK